MRIGKGLPPSTTAVGKALYYLGVVRFYKDGDGHGVVFRWWHPLTWIAFILMIFVCAFVSEATVQETIPLRVSKYFRENPKLLKWM